jgi:hypothetical protein
MLLTPEEISYFLYCPMLPKASRHLVYRPSTLLESCIRKAIKQAEKSCLVNGRDLNTRKIIKAWDNIWWPVCAAEGIDFAQAEKLTIKATSYFLDYCKYDISGQLYPTGAVDAEVKIPIGQSILHAHADLIKVDLTMGKRNMMLIDLSKKGISTSDTGLDPGIATTAMAFYTGTGEVIRYISAQVDENKDKLFITNSVFRPSDIEKTRKMVSHVENSLYRGVSYGDRWKCKECKACPSFRYLTKEDMHLK